MSARSISNRIARHAYRARSRDLIRILDFVYENVRPRELKVIVAEMQRLKKSETDMRDSH